MKAKDSASVRVRTASRPSLALFWVISVWVLAFLVLAPWAAQALGEGDPAPDFLLSGSDGETVSLDGLLEDHAGVVLAFFPRAFTPG